MQFRIKGVYSKEYPTAKGDARHHHYERASGKRLPDDPASMEFLDRIREVGGQSKARDRKRKAPLLRRQIDAIDENDVTERHA